MAAPNGLYRYNRQTDTFDPLAQENAELQIIYAFSIIEDDENNLWLGAVDGIYKLNQKRTHMVLYSAQNGVVNGDTFYDQAVYKKQDGELYFGNFRGYFSFYPNKLKPVPNNIQLYLSGFWLTNETLLVNKDGPLAQPLINTNEMKLDYNQNIFSFSFATIDFRNPGNQKFFYKLENFDADWRQTAAEERVQYFKVPPGKYILRFKTPNNNTGDWIEKSMVIIIAQPLWKSWWAYCIYALLLIALAFALHRYQKSRVIKAERERTRTKELAQAKEIEKAYHELRNTQAQLIQSEKMASLGELTAGIAHEIQNPLNFVNNFSEVNKELLAEMNEEIAKGNYDEVKSIAKDVTDNEEKIIFHGKRADSIVKGMLQHSRSSNGVKEPTNINALADEYLRLSYHGLRAKDKTFNATMKTDFDNSIGNINIIPQDIGRVVLNLLTNAFYVVDEKKKAEIENYEPTVSISTKKLGDKVEIKVADNGNGIPQKVLDKIFQPFFTTKPTGQGTGLGLSLSYDIVKAHGGELKVETKEGEGSTFIILLPQ